MSWSFSSTGTPQAILNELDKQNSTLTEQSKEEWEDAKPALKTLVSANAGPKTFVMLSANGHATFETKIIERDSEGSPTKTERVRISGQCSVDLKSLWGFVTE